MGMTDNPDRIWAWYDAEYDVISGGLKKFPLPLAVEYIRADLVKPEILFIREAALREAAEMCDRYPYLEGVKNAILELIGG